MFSIFKLASFIFFLFFLCASHASAATDNQLWSIQSIDTMKSSRDLSREKLNDPSFEQEIQSQMRDIANTGATHVAIGTPYDNEFLPYLRRWVESAREHDLSVWFRGNLSGWEGWFGYERIDRETHIRQIRSFILNNSGLFQDGDIFSSCPECENGGPGDPRTTGEVIPFRQFILDEYTVAQDAFSSIGKDVDANYYSMNADVAELIMDKETTKRLGGVVVIDHYVATPDELAADLKRIAAKSSGKIVLGEIGVAIPDIHGDLSDEERAEWLRDALQQLALLEELYGVNYWVNIGGTTQLWQEGGSRTPLVDILTTYYQADIIRGKIMDTNNNPVSGATITCRDKTTSSNQEGKFIFIHPAENDTLSIEHPDFLPKDLVLSQNTHEVSIVLEKESLLERVIKYLLRVLSLN